MAKIVGFVRDMGAGNVVSPILLELQKRKHRTMLYIEKGGKAEGRIKHPAEILGSAEEIELALVRERPDVVIVGLSSPNRNLEGMFEMVARSFGIPVVHAEDYLRAFVRSDMQADLILSIDESAAVLARAECPNAKVVIAGFAGIMPITLRSEVAEEFNRVRRETGAKILYCNDADPRDSESTVKLLVESILLTKIPVRLIFSPHPKYAPVIVAGGRTQGDVLQDVIATLLERGLLMQCPPGADGDEGVMLSDAMCSGYSTLLGRAAASGKTAITLRTPEAARTFKEATGLDETWLMLMKGGFPVIEKPTPLDDILATPVPSFNVKPLDVVIAADAILEIISK